jgi:autotransporter-associated beta strand protein
VLRLAIGLPLRNQAQLDQLLQNLYDPASPNFRRYLEAGEFADRFGPAPQDYQAVLAFAGSNHLTVTAQHPNRMLVDVAGSVADIERAFHLKMRVYAHPVEAREFYAPDGEPQLDLAVPVLHISGLDNYAPPRPLCHELTAPMRAAQPTPAAGSGPSGNYAGNDFRAAYAPGVTNTGVGQSVGLMEFQGYVASDIQTYEANYSLPNVPLSNVLLDGVASITTDDGGAECPLDIEMAIAMAPGLTRVIVYYGSATDDILNRMATDNLAKQLSASWLIGFDSTALQILQQFAAQGQSYFNASGDGDVVSPLPIDEPYLTAVGGTFLTTGAGGSWASETTWNRGNGIGSTGGISSTYAIPIWQQGISMDAIQGSAYMRNVPDVAMVAENVWVLFNNGATGAYGGTSCASPLWAGFMALVNQEAAAHAQPPVGFINPAVYALGKGATYGSTFHDITAGNNTDAANPTRFYAAAGYDLCTGWGTPKGQSLINALALSPFNPLAVTPTNGLAVAGPQGGPLTPASGIFTLANYGGSSLGWSLANTSSWFTVSPASGSLASGATANVTVTVASAANSLTAGYYSANLLFTNKSNSVVLTRPLSIVVGAGLTWDSSASGGAPQDGGGVWADQSSVNSQTNWYNGVTDFYWTNGNPDWAIFGAGSGVAGTVTLGGPVTAGGITFATPGSGSYTIAGGGYLLTLIGNILVNASAAISAPVTLGLPGTFTVASGQTLSVSGLLSGAAGNNLTVIGPGAVNLTGQNNTSPSSGMAGTVTVSSGTLSLNGGGSLYGALGNVAGIAINSGAALTLLGSNDISGQSGVPPNITLNSGALSDTGLNQAIGSLTLNGGSVSGSGSSTAGSYNLNGDCFVNGNTTLAAQNITTAPNSTFYVNSANTLTFTGTMIGSGGLKFAGPGMMILSSPNNTYAGGTAIRAGTLQLGNGGVGGSVAPGPVINGGVLQFNRSDNFSWTNAVSDPALSGSFVKTNSNTLTLLSTNAFLAPSGGVAQVNGGALLINPPGKLVCGGEFWVAENATTASCTIGGGTLIVSNWIAIGRNNSAASGTLTLNSGSIQKYTTNGNIIMGSLGGTGTMTVNGGTVSNSAAIWLGENSTGKGTLNLNGGLVQATQITRSTSPGLSAILNFNGGALQATTNQAVFLAIDQANVQAGNALIDDGGNAIVISQPLLAGIGGGGLIKSGSGTLTLTASNTYAGPTTVNRGALKVSPDPVLHLSFDNVSGTNVINDGAGGATMNGTLSGAGATIVSGGRFGNALSLNGTAYVLITNQVTPLNCNTGGAGWTYALWIKTAKSGATYGYQGDGTWSSTAQTTFYLNNNNATTGGTKAGGVRYADNWLTGTTAINNNNWHFVAITVNSGVKTIYVDGKVDAKTGTTGWVDAASASASQFWIGASPDTGDGDSYMNGLIDEVYAFSRALSLTEIQSLMTSNQLGNHQVLPPATPVTLAAGATLDLSSLSQTIGSLSGDNSSSVLLGGGTNFSAFAFGGASNTTFAGAISGNGSVTKVGSGTITLSGVNSFTGPTFLNAGTVTFGQSNNSNSVALLAPVLWFAFDQVGGGVVTNLGSGGPAMNGTLTGAGATIVSGGRYGNALSLNGASAYVLVPNKVTSLGCNAGGAGWTYALWIKTSRSGATYGYQGDGAWSSTAQTTFYLNNNNSTTGGTKAGGVRYGDNWLTGTTALNNNNWHFVAITVNSGVKTIYVDGNVDAKTGTTGWVDAASANASQFWIGGSPDTGDGDSYMNGLIDEVYLFNRALSQAEVLNIMANQSVDAIASSTGQLPASSPVSLAAIATLDLAGTSQNVASLSDLSGGGGLVTNSSSATAALVISNNTATTTTFSGQIDDASPSNAITLLKAGNNTQVLAGASACSSPAAISGGSLLVNGSLGTNTVTVNGGTLGGVGLINGPASVQSGGTLITGPASIGTLTFNAGLTLAAGATNVMKINKALQTNDQLVVAGTLGYGGILVLTNLGGALVAGDSFPLFNAGSYTGSYASLSPALPGPGLIWNTGTLAIDGTLRVQAAGPPDFGGFGISGANFVFSVTGGPPGSPYRIVTSTNAALPLTNWTPLWTNTFDTNGNGPQLANPINPALPGQFFDILVP